MNYEKILLYRNKHNAFANYIGLRVTEIKEGYARSEMPITEKHYNPIGSVHGGCLFTIADVTCGAAASSYGYNVTTVDSHIHYLRAGLNTTHLYGEAKEIKHGKKILVYEITVKDQNQVLLANAIFTFMSLGTKIQLEEDDSSPVISDSCSSS